MIVYNAITWFLVTTGISRAWGGRWLEESGKLPYSLVWHWKLVLAETSVAAVTRTYCMDQLHVVEGSSHYSGWLPRTSHCWEPGERCMTSTTFYALESSTVRRYNFKITLLKKNWLSSTLSFLLALGFDVDRLPVHSFDLGREWQSTGSCPHSKEDNQFLHFYSVLPPPTPTMWLRKTHNIECTILNILK